MENKFNELKARLLEINDLDSAGSLLFWDQSTYMPAGGAGARGRQSATLARISQEKMTDPALGKLLDDLKPYEESMPYESFEASLIRVTRRDYERAVKIPPAFMAQLYAHSAESYQVWSQARPDDNFKNVEPYLEKTLDYSRQISNFFPGYEHIADPLIDFADYGMKATTVRKIFQELREEIIPLVQAITSQEPADDSFLRSHFSEEEQMAFGRMVTECMGYDFSRGRIDKTHHPFSTKFSIGDVRITTRVNLNDMGENLFSLIHEAGHGMYEQGVSMEFEGTPLGSGTSAGVHESQSRTWENIIGRSYDFWKFFYPKLQEIFPDKFKNVSLESFYKAINKVQRSLIRTEADEVTYNLHVMIRFELELQLLEGKLSVRDLPEVWRTQYQDNLGIAADGDKDGVLQDVHWYAGIIGGGFQGYTLGNILASQFFNKALEAHPEIPVEFEQGKFETLLSWLQQNIYQHGRKFTAPELIKRVTGGPIRVEPYIQYLKGKYGELYGV